jgi:hypothetical protein
VAGAVDLGIISGEPPRLTHCHFLPVLIMAGIPAEIMFARSAPGLLGILQINARTPGGFVSAGRLPCSLRRNAGCASADHLARVTLLF